VNYQPAEVLEQCARAGIDRACVHSPRSKDYESANQYVGRICEQHREELIGFAVHDPQRESGRIRQLLTAEIKSLGLRGVRSDGPPTRELLDTAADLAIPVIYYPRMAYTEGPAHWYHMIATTYPKVNFILPHLGGYASNKWWTHIEAIDLVKRHPNVYVDTSGILEIKYLAMAIRELRPDKILFGSVAPELDARVAMETIRLMKLSHEHHAKIMGANLLRLLKI
jgi:predicted TIM-barrel fold metal-dependent hydrolase